MEKILHKIGSSDKGLLSIIGNILKLPIKFTQLQLLKLQQGDFKLIKKIYKDRTSHMWPNELAVILNCVKATKKIKGDIAEVGVYLGGSAKLICSVKENKILHLFDTFGGLPEPGEKDSSELKKNQYIGSLERVKNYINNSNEEASPDVCFYKGLFPETSTPVEGKEFSFVHLDVDLYKSTLDSLDFFYPRMTAGGIILSHDYSTLIGVKKAFDDFFEKKPEVVINLSTSQCLVVKLC